MFLGTFELLVDYDTPTLPLTRKRKEVGGS
jgi:hypothetical protein